MCLKVNTCYSTEGCAGANLAFEIECLGANNWSKNLSGIGCFAGCSGRTFRVLKIAVVQVVEG